MFPHMASGWTKPIEHVYAKICYVRASFLFSIHVPLSLILLTRQQQHQLLHSVLKAAGILCIWRAYSTQARVLSSGISAHMLGSELLIVFHLWL